VERISYGRSRRHPGLRLDPSRHHHPAPAASLLCIERTTRRVHVIRRADRGPVCNATRLRPSVGRPGSLQGLLSRVAARSWHLARPHERRPRRPVTRRDGRRRVPRGIVEASFDGRSTSAPRQTRVSTATLNTSVNRWRHCPGPAGRRVDRSNDAVHLVGDVTHRVTARRGTNPCSRSLTNPIPGLHTSEASSGHLHCRGSR
jgi:hypothetical protein